MVCQNASLRRVGGHPWLHLNYTFLDESESDLHEYTLDPTDPVVCLPDQDDPGYWTKRRSAGECKYGGPG